MRATVNGVTLHYETFGESGPLLLLIHGGSANPYFWHGQTSRLSNVCRMLTPGLRGYGLSEKIGPYSHQQFADDLFELTRHLHVSRCIVVGHSRASGVAITMAADHPELVAGLVCIAGLAYVRPERRERMKKLLNTVREQGIEGLETVAESTSQRALSAASHANMPALKAFIKTMILMDGPQTWADSFEASMDFDGRPALSKVRCPSLIVAGAEDGMYDIHEQEEIKRHLLGAELRVIPNAGHEVQQEQPGPFNALLLEFMSRIG